MENKEIQDLVKFVAKSGINEISIEKKDFKLVIKTCHSAVNLASSASIAVPYPIPAYAAPTPVSSPFDPAQHSIPQEVKESVGENISSYITVKSPMIGTFYRQSSPDKPPFVSIGDEIKVGQVICIIEAMKLFNEVESEVSGRIIKALVDNSTPVEYDQPLFLVEPI